MMNVGVAAGRQLFRFRTISKEWNVWSKWNLIHTCLVVRGGSLLILRFVGQRSRSQLLKIEHKFDIFLFPHNISSTRNLSTHMPHAERNTSHEQLDFRTFGALLIFFYFEWRMRVMVFSPTFNNVSVISWRSVLLVEYLEKTTDLPQVIDKLYHIM